MVTAIVIPIICIYFYWLTKKEMKEHREKWIQLENVPEEALITGFIQNIQIEKQRYYFHYYNLVIELLIRAQHKTYIVRKIRPLHEKTAPFLNQKGDYVRVYGKWEDGYFLLNRIERVQIIEKK